MSELPDVIPVCRNEFGKWWVDGGSLRLTNRFTSESIYHFEQYDADSDGTDFDTPQEALQDYWDWREDEFPTYSTAEEVMVFADRLARYVLDGMSSTCINTAVNSYKEARNRMKEASGRLT